MKEKYKVIFKYGDLKTNLFKQITLLGLRRVEYYFDTCIWRDHYEARSSLIGKPLGEYASKLFAKVIKDKILYSFLI